MNKFYLNCYLLFTDTESFSLHFGCISVYFNLRDFLRVQTAGVRIE